MKVDYQYFFLKLSVLILLLALFPVKWSIPLCLFLTWVYQYIVAAICGVHPMPTMDMVCFFGDDKTNVNFISFTIIDKFEFNKAREKIIRFMQEKPKLRYKIKKIMGDYYWQDTTIEESIDYVFKKIPKECHNVRDIEKFVNQDLNKEMPLNRPQW